MLTYPPPKKTTTTLHHRGNTTRLNTMPLVPITKTAPSPSPTTGKVPRSTLSLGNVIVFPSAIMEDFDLATIILNEFFFLIRP
jgi:hypothetical protein